MKKNLFAIGEGKLKININGFLSSICRDGVVGRPIYVLPAPMLLYSTCSATACSDVKTFRCFVHCVSLWHAAQSPCIKQPIALYEEIPAQLKDSVRQAKALEEGHKATDCHCGVMNTLLLGEMLVWPVCTDRGIKTLP